MKNALYIDDSKASRLLAEDAFKESKYQLTTIDNAKDAIKNLKDKHYDLVISDVVMPENDGLFFAKEITYSDIKTPFALTSSHMSMHVLNQYHGLSNYYGFILKPITPEKLDELIKTKKKRSSAVLQSILVCLFFALVGFLSIYFFRAGMQKIALIDDINMKPKQISIFGKFNE